MQVNQVVAGCAFSASTPRPLQSKHQAAAAWEAVGLGAASPVAAAREPVGLGAGAPAAARAAFVLGAAAWCNWRLGRLPAQVVVARGTY